MKLKEIVTKLKQELKDAQTDGPDAMFLLEECEVELGVELEAKGNGELEISVFGLGGKLGSETSRTSSHKMTLKFRPIPPVVSSQNTTEPDAPRKNFSPFFNQGPINNSLLLPLSGPRYLKDPSKDE